MKITKIIPLILCATFLCGCSPTLPDDPVDPDTPVEPDEPTLYTVNVPTSDEYVINGLKTNYLYESGENVSFSVTLLVNDKVITEVGYDETVLEAVEGTYSFTMPEHSVTLFVGTVDPKIEAYAYEPHLSEVMPEIRINTPDGSNEFATKWKRQDKLAGRIDYVDCTVTTANCDEEDIIVDKACEVKVRGNYTLEYNKKPLRLKFNKKTPLFGLNDGAECKSWVLLADWKDRSQLNNATTFYLGNTLLASDGYYSSDFKQVHVYLNDQYWGVYLLVEQQEANKYRMDLAEPEDDYTGTDIGYLLEFDGYYSEEDPNNGGDYTFTMTYANNRQLTKYNGNKYYPSQKGITIKSDITHTNQVNFIKNFMDNTFTIMYEAAYNDKAYVFDSTFSAISLDTTITPQEAIERVVDTKSLASMYLLQEIACDNDIDWSSFYMDVNFEEGNFKKLTFEAPWDFDSAYGIKKNTCNNAQGLYVANHENPWMNILVNEPWFQDLIKAKWAELVKYDVLTRTLEYIPTVTDLYAADYQRELDRWGSARLYNSELIDEVNNMKSQRLAAEYLVRWLKARYTSIHSYWGDGSELFPVEPEYEEIEGYEMYRLELENSVVSGRAQIKDQTTEFTASGGKYIGNVNSSDATSTFTFNLNSQIAQNVKFHFGMAKRNTSIEINDLFEFYLNDTKITFDEKYIPASVSDHWHEFASIYLGEMSLPQGNFKFEIRTTGISDTTNLDYIEFYAQEAVRFQA